MKKCFFYAVLVMLPFLVMEGFFRLLPVSNPPYILPVTAEQPVAHFQPNVDYRYSRDWNFSVVTRKRTNNYGYNNAADYQRLASTPLLMVVGDSFVEAHVVDSGKSAAELLNASVTGRGRVYSVGASGAPLSQYLVFAEFAKATFRPDAMAFVIIGNDFDESLLKYKSDHRFHYFDGKGVLQRIDYELPTAKKILRNSAFVRYVMLNLVADELIKRRFAPTRPKDESPAAYQTRIADSKGAIDLFFAQLPAKSGLSARAIAFVLDAPRPQIYSPEALAEVQESYYLQMRRYFAAQAAGLGYEVVDMQPVFIRRHQLDGSRFEVAPTDSHWNELAHRVVAQELGKSALFNNTFRTAEPIPVQLRASP